MPILHYNLQFAYYKIGINNVIYFKSISKVIYCKFSLLDNFGISQRLIIFKKIIQGIN